MSTALTTHAAPGKQKGSGERQIYELAKGLAKPLAKGLIAPGHADAALLCAALRGSRAGAVTHDPLDVAAIARSVMKLHAEQIAVKRLLTANAIREAIGPMIGIRAPANRIRAEAHDINRESNFLLSEEEVEEVAAMAVWCAMHPDQAGAA